MPRPILTYGDPILRQPAKAVADINGDLQQLIDHMVETMYAAPGVDWPPIRWLRRFGPTRPRITSRASSGRDQSRLVESEGEIIAEEGCLSIGVPRGCPARPPRPSGAWTERTRRRDRGRGSVGPILQPS
jgi:hypothetical protein